MVNLHSSKSQGLLEAEIEMRKKAEAELRLKNNKLNEAELIGRFGSFEWIVAKDLIVCSSGMIKLLDIKNRTELTFDEYLSFIQPSDREAEKARFYSFLQKKQFEKHYQQIVTSEGIVKIFITHGAVAVDDNGHPVKLICTSQDVTEIKRNKQLLEESRQTFKNAFEYSAIGIALVSPEGRWLDVNQAVCSMLKYSKEELLLCTFQEITHPDDLAADLKYVEMLLTRQLDTYQMEKRYLKKNGEIVWAQLSVSLVWHNEKPSFFISQIVDISAEKQLIEDIKQKNTELEKANKELKNHLNQITEFNSIIGHNLRGPATSLINLAEFLEENDNEQDRNFLLPKVKTTSISILNTLNDLRDFLEIQLDQKKQTEPVNIKKSLEQSLQMLESQIKETSAVINVNLAAESVWFPKVYLDSVFYNLLSNALKYRHPNRGVTINITSQHTAEYLMLTVADNGIGVDLKKHGNDIFRYKKIFHKGYDSNGVGLFLTRTQIEAFNGHINIESKVNEGTTFYIYFQKSNIL